MVIMATGLAKVGLVDVQANLLNVSLLVVLIRTVLCNTGLGLVL